MPRGCPALSSMIVLVGYGVTDSRRWERATLPPMQKSNQLSAKKHCPMKSKCSSWRQLAAQVSFTLLAHHPFLSLSPRVFVVSSSATVPACVLRALSLPDVCCQARQDLRHGSYNEDRQHHPRAGEGQLFVVVSLEGMRHQNPTPEQTKQLSRAARAQPHGSSLRPAAAATTAPLPVPLHCCFASAEKKGDAKRTETLVGKARH